MRNDYKMKRGSFRFNGRRYEVYGKTQAEVNRKIGEKKAALERGEVLIQSTMLVKDWAEKCIDTYKSNLTPYVMNNYRYMMRHYIVEDIGNMRLKDVKPLTCQMLINKYEGKSKCLINEIYQMLNFIFQKAVDNELLNKNPAKSITRPSGTKEYRRALTQYEEAVFLRVVSQHHYGLFFMFMYGCGCRPSEAANITGRDITYHDNKPLLHIRGTKSKAADRYVPIPPVVEKMLPANLDPFQLLCTKENGTPIDKKARERAWKSLSRLMNIEMGCKVYRNELIPPYPLAPDLCPYCLRHTYCTNLQKRGVDIRTAQRLMGHSDIKMTANIYTHVSKELIINDYDLITGASSQNEEVEKVFRIG